MITAKKTVKDAQGNIHESGLTRSSAGEAKKGEKGKIEFWLQRESADSFSSNFLDTGNYGKDRWSGAAIKPISDLDRVIQLLCDFRDGKIDSTRVTEPETQPAQDTEDTKAVVVATPAPTATTTSSKPKSTDTTQTTSAA
jgi:hypothetical protein